MMRIWAFGILWLTFMTTAAGQEYKVSPVATPGPADAVSPEIAALLQPAGFQVAADNGQVLCQIWLAKEWPVAVDATTSAETLYPLTPGQFFGVARFARGASDFREQEFPAGVYVLRYGQQPIDGAHVGTSPTRDFLLLLPAAKDLDPAVQDYKTLTTLSKEAAGTAHPAILSLQKAEEGDQPLSVRQNTDMEWTIVRFAGKVKQGSDVKNLPVELVVVGKAAE